MSLIQVISIHVQSTDYNNKSPILTFTIYSICEKGPWPINYRGRLIFRSLVFLDIPDYKTEPFFFLLHLVYW